MAFVASSISSASSSEDESLALATLASPALLLTDPPVPAPTDAAAAPLSSS